VTRDPKRQEAVDALSREADRIVNLILHTNMPRVDIEIQIERFRAECLRRYPQADDLFEMIYESRFRRIWDQWHDDRPAGGEPWPTAWDD